MRIINVHRALAIIIHYVASGPFAAEGVRARLCTFNTSNSIKNCIFVFVILTGNYLHTGKRLALFLTDESGQFVVTGIMFNRLCLAISGFAHAIAKREQPNLIRHKSPSRTNQ